MSNEFLAVLIPLISLIVIFLAYTQGRVWLVGAVIVVHLMAYTVSALSFPVFALSLSAGVAIYMPSYLATDLMAEKYGRAQAFEAVRLLLACYIVVPLLFFIVLAAEPDEQTRGLHEHLSAVFATSWRMSIAAVITNFFAQNFDVWFYDFIHRKTGGKMLWLRNCLSTGISSFMDTFLFWSIAFYGILPNWASLALVSYFLKVFVAAADTPFVYLAKKITPRDLRTAPT